MELARTMRTEIGGKTESSKSPPPVVARIKASPARTALLRDQRPALRLSDPKTTGAAPKPSPVIAGPLGHDHEEQVRRAVVTARLLPVPDPPRNTSRQPDERNDRGTAAPASFGHAGLGGGRPLSPYLRSQFEQAFDWDFSGVRIHTGSAAAEAATRAGARAFTKGLDIVFGATVSDPESSAHRDVLAHELAHVVQQGKSTGRAAFMNPAGGRAPVSKRIAAGLSAAPSGRLQADPIVTAVNSPAELGAGRSIEATATAAGRGTLDWSLVGAPAGVTIARHGHRGATLRANPATVLSAGATFNIQASLRGAVPPDTKQRAAPITLVGITAINFRQNPAFAAAGAFAPAVLTTLPAANSVDPNRNGLTGNTAVVTPVVSPAARPLGMRVTFLRPLGATVVGMVITPGTTTGNVLVRLTDIATGTTADNILIVNPVPLTTNQIRPFAHLGPYGVHNALRFTSSDSTGVLSRLVGETITAGATDDFHMLPGLNHGTGPNPAPMLSLAGAADAMGDQLVALAGANTSPAGDANLINVNRYVGPGAPAGLPRMTELRQGLRFLGWRVGMNWSNEFDHGVHRHVLVALGANFRTEHVLTGARSTSPPPPDPYVGPPLIMLSNVAARPAAPPAGALAADGHATANVTANIGPTAPLSVLPRRLQWSALTGPLVFTVPPGGAAAPVAASPATATVRAGLVPGTFRLRANDSVFPWRRAEGDITLVAVNLRQIAAPVRTVPPTVLTARINVTADPGGRDIEWNVDPLASAAGVRATANPVPAAAAPTAARSGTVTRPAGFVGRVTVTAHDRVLPARTASIVIDFH